MNGDGDAPRDLAFFVALPDRLRTAPAEWPMARRMATAKEMIAFLEEVPFDDSLREAIHVLAADPAATVRRETAETLPLLPDDFFDEMAGTLGSDKNSYVREAARRAAERRGKGTRRSNRLRKEVLEVQERFEGFADEYGARAARRARRMANDLFETLIGATLHDLVGILPAMRLGLEAMQKHFSTGKPGMTSCQTKLESMCKQLDRYKLFTENMRLYAKAKPKRRTTVRFAEVVDEAIGIVRDGLETPNALVMQADVPADLRASVYESLAVMALMHLIRNAAEAVLESSLTKNKRVVIHARPHAAGGVVVKVTDNGPGIDEQTLDDLRMFIPGKTTKARKGTGFGLPTAQRYAEAHGGVLDIESTQGKGSIFTLTLPPEGEDDE